MDPAVRLAARSLNGCWTCRVRKKKCDETAPVCRSCISFGLECHGYGPRPEWMDNGRLQKEQAAKFKEIVSQQKSMNRKERVPREARAPRDFNQSRTPLSTDDARTHTASSSASQSLDFNDNGNMGGYEQFLDMTSNSFIDPTWIAPPYSACLPSAPPSLMNGEAHRHPVAFLRNMNSTQSSLTPGSLGVLSWPFLGMIDAHDVRAAQDAAVPQDEMGLAMSGQPGSAVDETWHSLSSPNDASFSSPTSVSNNVAVMPTCRGHHMAPENYRRNKGLSEDLVGPVRDGGAADALFMHYLDRVFYIQYPFYLSHDRRGRGCLFSILRMVKPAYLATLALSERDLVSTQPQQGNIIASFTQLRSKGSYHSLAVQETQRLLQESYTWNKSPHMIHNIEPLTSILQLFFWELFAGGTGNWQALLREAARLIPSLLEARTLLANPRSAGADYTEPEHHTETHSPERHCATSILLGSFISLDIISSASTRQRPFLKIDHAHALRDPCISLESIIGCSNSVMSLIFEISSLDRWKEESQAVRKLSIIELAERGRQIEERLRQELVDMDSSSTTSSTLLNYSRVLSAPAHPDVNRLFALSALIYLHVVISGAHPELPEIADAVSRIIAVFKALWDRRLLQSILVWPFCVAGCLALGEQQNFFRDLISATGITESTVGTCFEAFKIMQRCWEARKTGPFNGDWVSIMKQQGIYILLR